MRTAACAKPRRYWATSAPPFKRNKTPAKRFADRCKPWLQAMAASHARETASMAGDFAEMKGAIEALSRRVEEATAGLTIRLELP